MIAGNVIGHTIQRGCDRSKNCRNSRNGIVLRIEETKSGNVIGLTIATRA